MATSTNNPFIGLRTYEEADAAVFRGRSGASADLYRLIIENETIVLHAESGEGKSSLLNAGLTPLLRKNRYFPIKINFTEEDFKLENPDFDSIVFERISNAIRQKNGDLDDTDVFSDCESDDKVVLSPVVSEQFSLEDYPELKHNIWWLLRNYTLTVFGIHLTPVLVFDQSEEVFTRPDDIAWTDAFFSWLSTNLSDEIPQPIVDKVRAKIGEGKKFPDLSTRKRFKTLMSLRTEYMGELDYWAIQRHRILVMKNSRYCLKPLTEAEADEVLSLHPSFTSEDRRNIKDAIRSKSTSRHNIPDLPVIPAILLSVVCVTAADNLSKNDSRLKGINSVEEKTGSSADIFTNIIGQFYKKEVASANLPFKGMRKIENILVDDNGKRVRIKTDSKELAQLKFEEKYKDELEKRRLIKCTRINGAEYVELSHDALASVIMSNRKKDNDRTEQFKNLAITIGWFLIVGLSMLYWVYLFDHLFKPKRALLLITTQTVIASAYTGTVYATYKATRHKNKCLSALCISTALLGTQIICYFLFALLDAHLFNIPIRMSLSTLGMKRLLMMGLSDFLLILPGILSIQKKNTIYRIIGFSLILSGLCVFYNVRIIAQLGVFSFAIFCLYGYIFARDKNIIKFSFAAFLILSVANANLLPYNSSNSLDISILYNWSFVIISGILCIYGAFQPKKRTLGQAIDFVFSKDYYHKYTAILIGFRFFVLVLCLGIAQILGHTLEFRMSLILAPVLITIIYSILLYLSPLKFIGKWKWTIMTSVAVATLSLGLSMFSTHKIPYFICASLPIILLIICLYINKVKSVPIIAINLLLILFALTLPKIAYGLNIYKLHGTALSLNSVQDLSDGIYGKVNVLIVHNADGKVGIIDPKGNVIIPCRYDRIEKLSNGFGTSFGLQNGNNYSIWKLYEHLRDRNALTDFFYDESYITTYDSKSMFAGKAERDPSACRKIAEEKINNILDINTLKENTIGSYDFSYMNYSNLDVDALPFTSRRYQKIFKDKVLPQLEVFAQVSADDLMSGTLSTEDFENRIKDSDAMDRYVSNEINIESVARYQTGRFFLWLSRLYLDLGDTQKAQDYASEALLRGRFAEPALVEYIVAGLLSGDDSEAKYLQDKQLELIRINDGLEFPDPDMTEAWKFLRYNTLYNLVEERLSRLYDEGFDKDKIERAKSLFATVIKKPLFDNESTIGYRSIQKLPNGDLRLEGTYSSINDYGIMPRNYSLFVCDGKMISSPIAWISPPYDSEEMPSVVVDCLSGKRRFIKDGTKFAYRESLAAEFLPGDYDHAWPFSEGLAAVEVDGKIGFIDSEGSLVIKPQFESEYKRSKATDKKLNIYSQTDIQPIFTDGVAMVYSDSTLVAIDHKGDIVDRY